MNKVILSGRLTKEVNVKYLNTGIAVGELTIAVNEKVKKQDGSAKENVCFIDVSIFGNGANILSQYCHKGSKVLVEGKLMQSNYVNQQGANVTRFYVACEHFEFMGTSNNNNQNLNNTQEYYEAQRNYQQQNNMNIQNKQDITNQVNLNQNIPTQQSQAINQQNTQNATKIQNNPAIKDFEYSPADYNEEIPF